MSLADIQSMKALKLAKRIIGVPYPQNFPWQPLNIYKVGKRQYETDLDIEKYRNQGANKTYYVSTGGLVGNDGLTPSTPTRMSTALQKSDVDRIIVQPGIYNKDLCFAGVIPTRNISIIGMGQVIFSNHDASLTWTATAGQTNVYQANRTAVSNVFDASTPNANGDYTKLTAQTSIVNVNANVGSYYFDSTNNIVYVKTSDQRQPDSNIRVYLGTDSNICAGNTITYMENIQFHGGLNPFRCYSINGIRPIVVAKGCKFKYGGQGGSGCFASQGATTYLIDCECAYGEQDGFNYHANVGTVPYFVEIDCIGRNNGMQDDNDNGSTSHDASIGIRVNGKYYSNKGPNVIDINDNTITLCVGTESYDSLSVQTILRSNFHTYGETNAKSLMYLYDCYSHGSSAYDVNLQSYGQMKIKAAELAIGSVGTAVTSILDTY